MNETITLATFIETHGLTMTVMPPQKWRCGKPEAGEFGIVYEEPATYLYVGCDHRWKKISRPSGCRSGLHTDECELCGIRTSYDTSD